MAAEFCTGCGRSADECAGCSPELDPPRFCADCSKRLTVRVTPAGWLARCNRCATDLRSA